MTHTLRQQQKPSLSVRTRALLLKKHERLAANRRVSPVLSNSDMRLRTRNVQPHTNITTDDLKNDSNLESSSVNPVISSASSTTSADSMELINNTAVCKWEHCGSLIDSSELIRHIQDTHVLPQMLSNRRKSFTCRWQGCRVFRQPSVSSAWLENHILHHTDARGKPFCCIFGGCELRFSTSISLERHVRRTHMRVTRTMSCSDIKTPINPSEIHEPETANLHAPPDSTESTFVIPASPIHTNSKRTSKKRRRLKCYRVRRSDFYDRRSQCVVKNRLELMQLCSSRMDQVAKNVQSATYSATSCIPAPISMSPKGRLRSDRGSISSYYPVSKPNIDPALERLQLALLLATPHTVVGQRISIDNKPDLLIRWTGNTGLNNAMTMWISKRIVESSTLMTFNP